MSLPWILACIGFFVLSTLAYLPARIAAQKDRSFGLWYLYGFVLWPLAFFHARSLKEPERKTLKPKQKESAEEDAPNAVAEKLYAERLQFTQTDLNASADVLSYEIFRGNDGKTYGQLSLRNLCYGTATSILLQVTAYDAAQQVLTVRDQLDFPLVLDQLELFPGLVYHTKVPFAVPPQAAALSFVVREVFYQDGSSRENRAPQLVCYQVALVEDYDQVLALKSYTGHAVCLPQRLNENWICVCGRLNRHDDACCVFCQNNQQQLFTECTLEWLKTAAKEQAEQRRLTSEKNKQLLAERTQQQQMEAQQRYEEIAARKAAHHAKLRRRRNFLLATAAIVIVGIGVVWFARVQFRGSENCRLALLAQEAGQTELAYDYYGLANAQKYANEMNQLTLGEHATNANSVFYFENDPQLQKTLPTGAFVCEVYDNKVFYRSSEDGMDKKVYVLDQADAEPRLLVEYEEKARGYTCIAGDFVVIESTRMDDGGLRFVDIETGEQQLLRFAVKALDVSKTKDGRLLVHYYADYDQSHNYFEVYQDLNGNWKSRRVLEGAYLQAMQQLLYHPSVVETPAS